MPDLVDQLRERLRSFVSYKEGEKIRGMLAKHAEYYYIPLHNPRAYIEFLKGRYVSITEVGAQSTNHPHVWGLFTDASQHVYGDCLEECLDRAMEIANDKTKHGRGINIRRVP